MSRRTAEILLVVIGLTAIAMVVAAFTWAIPDMARSCQDAGGRFVHIGKTWSCYPDPAVHPTH
jgi:hypothetical protein